MDLRPGYKQTEVGVIPEDWEVRSITDVTHAIFLGLTSKVDYVSSGGIPLIRASDIASGRLSFVAARSISVRQHRELTKYRRAKRGNVLVSKSGSLGVCAIVDVDTEFSIYESIIVLQPREILDPSFLLSLLRDDATQARMIGEKVGSTVGHLNLEMFRKLTVALPSVPEQRAIAASLSDVDALLSGLDQLIAKKRDLKQATTQQLLTGQARLPGFTAKWETASLGEVVTRTAGFWGIDNPDAGHPKYVEVIRAGDVSPHGRLLSTAPRYFSESEFAKAQCRLDDVVITTSGSVGKVWWCDGRSDVVASNFVRVLRPISSRLDGRYLFQLLLSDGTQRLMLEHIATGVMANLGSSFFAKEWLALPPIAEQSAIADVLSDIDAEVEALEARRDKTHNIKKAMMQELLTGKTRLVNGGARV